MSSKRGRKRNDNLPPNRARDVQRAFRARRAAHLQVSPCRSTICRISSPSNVVPPLLLGFGTKGDRTRRRKRAVSRSTQASSLQSICLGQGPDGEGQTETTVYFSPVKFRQFHPGYQPHTSIVIIVDSLNPRQEFEITAELIRVSISIVDSSSLALAFQFNVHSQSTVREGAPHFAGPRDRFLVGSPYECRDAQGTATERQPTHLPSHRFFHAKPWASFCTAPANVVWL